MLNQVLHWRRGTYFFAIPAIVITLLTVASPSVLIFHFLEVNALYIMLLYLGLGLALYVAGRHQSMFVSFACCALMCYTLQERSACALGRPAVGGGPQLKAAHFDLDVLSLPTDSIVRTIQRIDADIISLQGVHTDHFAPVHNILTAERYPYFQFSQATPTPPGLAVYSKEPFSYVRKAGNAQISSVMGSVEPASSGAFHFIGVYFSPAEDESSYAELLRQIQALGLQSKQIDAPLLVFGNYNLKPWSRTIQQYKMFSHLKNSRRGMQPTAPHGYLSILDNLSDHIFYSDHFKCISFETISCGKEPHLGISGTFEWVKHEKGMDQSKNTEL